MGTLRCPMCCKRKFRSQLSLKYHILSYMYNIFCTLCWRRVESLQEVLDHLDAGCDQAYAAGWRDDRAKHAAVQTRVCIWPLTEEVQDPSAHCSCHTKPVQLEEMEGSLSDDDCSWTLMDCEDDAAPELPVGHESAGQGSAGCDTRDGAMPDCGPCNSISEEHSKKMHKSPERQLFACDVCHTTFLCVEEHVRLHHLHQDVEVHSRNSSTLQFPKSRLELLPGENGGETVQTSVAQDSANGNSKEGQMAADSRVPEPTDEPCSLLEKALNGAGTSEAKVVGRVQRLSRCGKPSGSNKCRSDKDTIYINHRDTEHSYSSTCTKALPYATHTQRSSVADDEPKDDSSCDKGKKDGETQCDISKDKMLCVCGSHSQHGDKQKLSSTAIEFSEAIPKLFSQKNGKEIPTVVVFRGNKLSSILTPMTSRVNMKSLQRCTTLQELVSVIGSQTEKTYRSAAVKSTGEPVFKYSSGIPYSDSVHNSTVERSESSVCAMEKEASREGDVYDVGKHNPVSAFSRKRMRNETAFTVKKSVDSNGRVINNTYTCCNCGDEFQKYLSFCKHDCDGVISDCDINFMNKSMLTVQFTGLEPEVDSQKSVIEIGLGVNTEPEAHVAGGWSKEGENVMADAANSDMADVNADVNCDGTESQKPKRFEVEENLLASKTLVCRTCAIFFKSRVAFVGHQRMHAPKVVRPEHNADGTPVDYTCRICSFVAEHRRGLKQHMRVHLPEELEQHCTEVRETGSSEAEPGQPQTLRQGKEAAGDNEDVTALNFSCRLCGVVYPELAHLNEHILVDHLNDDEYTSTLVDAAVERAVAASPHTFTCEICLKKIDVVFRQVHGKTHLGDERFKCDICKENLYTREQFNLHMRAHKGDNPYPCRVCKKKFSSLEVLEKHIVSHNGSKRYACRFCDRCFKRPITRVEHERMHTGEKPFSCSFCGMKFRLKGTRELHLRIHTGLKPYSCQVCKKRFRSHNSLTAHMATHSDERNFKCSLCPKTYKTAVALSTHKKNHTKPYKCEICQRRFISSHLERQHRLSHSAVKNGLKYKCIVCGMMYARPFALRDHMSTHNADTTDQPSEVEDASGKHNLNMESMEIIDDEATQTVDYAFIHMDEECTKTAQFLVVNSNEDCLETQSCIAQVDDSNEDCLETQSCIVQLVDDSNEDCLETQSCIVQVVDEGEASSEFGVNPEEACLRTSEHVVNVDNEDMDCAESILAISDDLTAGQAYLIADDGECQPVLLVETNEGASVSEYIVEVPSGELTATQSASSEIYDQVKPSVVVHTREQGVDGCLVDFLNHMGMEGNEYVTPLPSNFEEVETVE